MIVYGVSKSGKDVRVNDDFSIHIPYGYCYDIGNEDAGDETALFLAKPAWHPAGYTSGAFSISDDTECDLTLSLKATHEVTVAPDAEELGIDFNQMLEELSENADNHTMSMDVSLNGVSRATETFGEGDFRRTYRVAMDEPFLKAGYFTLGILGRTAYSVVILTRHYMYSATTIPPAQRHSSVERELSDLLSSVAVLSNEVYRKSKASGTGKSPSAAKGQKKSIPDSYKGKNGKLDAFQVAKWFCRDVLFSNDGDFPFDGKHHTMKGLQMNAASPQIAEVAPIMDVLQPEIEQVFRFVERNENLMISKRSFHKEILRATRGEPITGLTVFDLCAWHMLMLMRSSDDDYTAFVDRNLVKGIPDAYAFVGEFIRTLRHYNGQKKNFRVYFNLVNNMDSPCGEIDTPVSSAVCKVIGELTFHGSSAASDEKLPTVAQERKQASDQIQKLEDALGESLCAALKQEACTAKKKLDAYARAIRDSNFSRLRSMDGVLNRLKALKENNSELKGIGFEINYIQCRFSVTYSPESVRVDGDYFVCGVSAGFPSEPKDLAENLAAKIDAVTAEELYLSLLKQADEMQRAGKKIQAPGGGTVKRGKAPKVTTSKPPAPKASASKSSASKASATKASAPAAVRRSKAGAQTRAASTSYSDDRIAANVKSEAASAKQRLDDFAQRLEQSDVMQQSSMDGALRRIKSLPDMAPALKQITVNVLYSEHRVDIICTTGKICGIDKELSYSVSVGFSGFSTDPKIFARELAESLRAASAEGLLGIFAEQTEQAIGYALPQLRPHEEFAERRAALQEKGPKQCREWAVLSDDERDALLRQEALEAKELFAVFADAVQQSDVTQQRSMDGALRRLTSLAEDGELFAQLSVQIHYSEHMVEVIYLSDGIIRGDKAVTCSVSAGFEGYSAEPKVMVKSLADALYAAAPEALYQQMTDLNRSTPTLTPAQKQATQEEPQRDIQEMRRKIMQERDEELAAWQKACDDAADRRAEGERLRRAELDDALKEKKKQLEESRAAAELTEQMDTIKQQLAAQNNELASLKWLDFSGKSRLKKAIADGQRRMAALEKERADEEARYAAEVQRAEEEHAQAVRQIGQEMKEKYPAPKDTEKTITERAKKRLMGCALQLLENGSLDEASIDAWAKTSTAAQMVEVADFLDSHEGDFS